MAKINTDVLIVGSNLSGLITAAMLKKRGARVALIPFGNQRENAGLTTHDFWPSFAVPCVRQVFDFLDLHLEYARNFTTGSPFAFIEEGQVNLLFHHVPETPLADLTRAYQTHGASFKSAIERFTPHTLESALHELSVPEWNLEPLDRLNKFFLRKKRQLAIRCSPESSHQLAPEMFRNFLDLKSSVCGKTIGDTVMGSDLTFLCFRHGITVPKNDELTIEDALRDLFRDFLMRSGALFMPSQIKGMTPWRHLAEIPLVNGDTLAPRLVIDATAEGLLKDSHLESPEHPLEQQALSLVKHECIPQAFPKMGVFLTTYGSDRILCRYRLAPLSTKTALGFKDIDTSTHQALWLNAVAPQALVTHDLQGEMRRIARRHFSADGQTLPPFLPCNEPTGSNTPRLTTTTANLWRASAERAPVLGMYSHFATGLALYGMLGKRLGLKLS